MNEHFSLDVGGGHVAVEIQCNAAQYASSANKVFSFIKTNQRVMKKQRR
jgi:hypothetical protein